MGSNNLISLEVKNFPHPNFLSHVDSNPFKILDLISVFCTSEQVPNIIFLQWICTNVVAPHNRVSKTGVRIREIDMYLFVLTKIIRDIIRF
jgi:hypothetical protein